MDMQRTPAQRADARLGDIANRSEKGTALKLIRADAKAVNDKTARLKALRLEHEAAAALIEKPKAKPVRKPPGGGKVGAPTSDAYLAGIDVCCRN